MVSLLFAMLLAIAAPAPQRWGYQVKASCYPYATTNLSADAEPGDVVTWQLPSEVSARISPDGHFASLWVAGTDDDGSPVTYWAGRYEASYTVYRTGRPPRRVEFFIVVK